MASVAPEQVLEDRSKAKVFISYSRKDMAFADRLEAALKARGFEPLIDREEIYAFEDWWKRIEALLSGADTVVFVLSPDAVASETALKELTHAASLNKRFAPIVCRRVEDGAVPEALRRLNFIFFDDPARFETSADQLAEALRTDIGWIRRHTEFGERAREWTENGHAPGLLLRPPILDQAETWRALRPTGAPSPTAETDLYLAESRRADTENRTKEARAKKWWRVAQVTIFVLLVGIILGLVGWIKQDYLTAQWRWWTVTWPYARANVWPYVLSAAKEQTFKLAESFKECAQDCPEMIVIPAGSFTMGDPANISTQPQHTVTISKRFAVAKYELTFADWDACVAGSGCNGYRPYDEDWGRGPQPVINVNWNDAQAYVDWLAVVTGKPYRLLSEAEYEYAMRAGTSMAYPWGDDLKLNGQAMADCDGCGSNWDKQQPAPVGSFPANKFGLYDMVGNVLVWTEDCVHQNYKGAPADGSAWLQANSGDCSARVLRGGSWDAIPDSLYFAVRGAYSSETRATYIGFRVARTLNP
jgi:formylglycine-generating enzyme required for sulfatase activity